MAERRDQVKAMRSLIVDTTPPILAIEVERRNLGVTHSYFIIEHSCFLAVESLEFKSKLSCRVPYIHEVPRGLGQCRHCLALSGRISGAYPGNNLTTDINRTEARRLFRLRHVVYLL